MPKAHDEDLSEVALNDLVYRRTSPYYPDDAYTLIGEHLTLAYAGCRFVGFRRSEYRSDAERNIYLGISRADQDQYRTQLDKAMDDALAMPPAIDVSETLRFAIEADANATSLSDDVMELFTTHGFHLPRGAVLSRRMKTTVVVANGEDVYALAFNKGQLIFHPIVYASFYRERRAVVCRQVILTKSEVIEGINDERDARYWEPPFLQRAMRTTFDTYADRLIDIAEKFVLFWNKDSELTSLDRAALVRAIINAIPVQRTQPVTRSPRLPVDDIDVMRWFTARFEATWHLQPNEQMGFLVLETQSHSASPAAADEGNDDRAGEKLGFEGWLVYKYTGNLFVTAPTEVARLLRLIRREIDACEKLDDLADDTFARDTARSLVKQLLDGCFEQLAEYGASPGSRAADSADDDTDGERNANAEEFAEATKALAEMKVHLLTAIAKVDEHLAKGDCGSYWLKPILRAPTLADARTVDEQTIISIVALCESDAPVANTPHAKAVWATGTIATMFYVNLFLRRVLLEIPQTLNLGFAPYFMEVGFADPEVLSDGNKFTPRRDARLIEPWHRKEDAVYKLLGEIERFFGIGGADPWTFYMPAAPLFAHGQRRGFIFVTGYYDRDWLDASPDLKLRLQHRLMYLSRLLRANAYYAGKELQEAYNRRFRKEITSFLRDNIGTLEDGLINSMHYLCNLRGPIALDRNGNEGIAPSMDISLFNDNLTLPMLTVANDAAEPTLLQIPLLRGEIEGFVRSGLFPLICTLSDADAFSALKDKVSADLRSFLRTSRHNLSNVITKGIVPFDVGIREQRTANSRARWIYAQGESLLPLLQFSYSLVGAGAAASRKRFPIVLALVDGFRRAVNLYFAQRGLARSGEERFQYADDAVHKGVDCNPWQLALSIDYGPRLSTSNPVLFTDRSPMRAVVDQSPDVTTSGHGMRGLAEGTRGDEWQDVAVDRPRMFAEAVSNATVNESQHGVAVIFHELLYNACKHGTAGEIRASLTRSGRRTRVEIRNTCVPTDGPLKAEQEHGLATLVTFANLLGVRFEWDPSAPRAGAFVASLECSRE